MKCVCMYMCISSVLILEKLEEEKKEVDVKRQEHINSLTLQLKEKSDQKIVVEQLQQKIAEEDARRKQMDQNLDKEKENNRRLYMQYLKTLKEFQNLLGQHKIYFRNKIDYEHDVTKQLNSLKEEKVFIVQHLLLCDWLYKNPPCLHVLHMFTKTTVIS